MASGCVVDAESAPVSPYSVTPSRAGRVLLTKRQGEKDNRPGHYLFRCCWNLAYYEPCIDRIAKCLYAIRHQTSTFYSSTSSCIIEADHIRNGDWLYG